MKKEIVSMLAIIALLTGCEKVNQPQVSTTKKQEVVSKKTNITLDMKKELNEFYNIWKNTRYKAGGKNTRGIDSSALTQLFFKDRFNIEVPRRAYNQVKIGVEVDKEDLKLGDILVFKRKKEFYTGVYMGENKFIHSSFRGVKIENLEKSPYKNIYYTARRVF